MDRAFEKPYQVRPNESDLYNELKVVSLLDLLQDIAWEHAGRLGLSVTDLLRDGRTWVLSRMHLQVKKTVPQGTELIIRTWPAGIHRLYAIREFSVRDTRGATVAAATSGWVILRADSLRPERPDRLLDRVKVLPERAVDDTFKPIPVLDPSAVQADRHFSVRWFDCDLNQHVNNTVYPAWALEALPDSFLQEHRCTRLEIQYVGMANYGDRAVSQYGPPATPAAESTSWLHRISRESDGADWTRLRSIWTPR